MTCVRLIVTVTALAMAAPAVAENLSRPAQIGGKTLSPTKVAGPIVPGKVSEIRISVPYSFTNVPPEMKNAMIACFLYGTTMDQIVPNNFFMEKTTVIPFSGIGKSGTAVLVFKDFQQGSYKRLVSDAKSYICSIRWLNDGIKNNGNCAWDEAAGYACTAQPGSVRKVMGAIP